MRKMILTTMKNEGPYLLEWLAYHRGIGFTDFCVFSNDCSDGSNLMLDRLEAMGVLRHFDNPIGPGMDPQRAAYSRANRMDWVRSADWLMVIDADEFLNVKCGDQSVDALLTACDGADAISLNWKLMGSGGARERDEEALVTERFTRGSTDHAPENGLVWGFKTLFRPAKFDYFGVHRPKWEKKKDPEPHWVTWVNGSGQPMGEKILTKGWRSSKDNVGYDLAQVNHYAVKSREDFLIKRLRGTANSKNKGRIDLDYWDRYDLNASQDASIPTGHIRAIMNDWLSDPDLAALHRASLRNARKLLDTQLTDPDLRAFVEGTPVEGPS